MAVLEDFKKFALRGNMIDLAIGFTVGAAFTTIVRSLVDDILMPPIGLLLGGADFSDYFWILKPGPEAAPPYVNLAAAKEAGAVTMNYGAFLTHLLTFAVVAFAMYLVIHAINKLDAELEERFSEKDATPGAPAEKKCPFCLATIPYRATRCAQCTSHLEEPGIGS